MGDAAHTIHPLAGLGLNVGLSDAMAWLKLLQPENNYQWSSRTLRAYQRQRKSAVWQIIALMDGLKALFANPLPPIALLRGIGLNGCNRLPFLKRLFIAHSSEL
jgi:2-octaprenylphenol hydroxylase